MLVNGATQLHVAALFTMRKFNKCLHCETEPNCFNYVDMHIR